MLYYPGMPINIDLDTSDTWTPLQAEKGPATSKQRERLDYLISKQKSCNQYQQILALASNLNGREIKSIGEMSGREIEKVIKEMVKR